MRTTILVLTACAVMWTSALSQAQLPPKTIVGKHLTVRVLIPDQPTRKPDKERIADILPALQKTLKFKTYHLLKSERITIAKGRKVTLDQVLTLLLKEAEGESLTVEVQTKANVKPGAKPRKLSQLKLALRDDKPIILGGFPGNKETTTIVVLNLK